MSLYEVLKASKTQQFPDYWTLLWGRKLSASMIKTLTGALPLTFTAKGGNAIDWIIYGNSDTVGERTKNLVDLSGVTDSTHNGVTFTVDKTNGTITANRIETSTNSSAKAFTMTLPAGSYIFSCGENSQRDITYDSYLRIGGSSPMTIARDNPNDPPGSEFNLTAETTVTLYIRIQSSYDAQNLVFKPMVRLANTTHEFIPYGYQITITVSQDEENYKNYEIFIGDAPLGEGETVSKTSTGINIELFEGSNTVSTTLTNKPEMTIKYK